MYTFAGQEYAVRLPADAPPYVAACLANDAPAIREMLANSSLDATCEATVLFTEMDMEFEETFSLLFLAVLAGATDVAALLLDAGATADDVADLATRAFQHAAGEGNAHPDPAFFETTDLNRLRVVLGHTAQHGTVRVAPEHFVAGDGTEGLAAALLWVGCVPSSLAVPLPTAEALAGFCALMRRLAPATLVDLGAPRCLQWARDPARTPISEAAWAEGAQPLHPEVPALCFTDVALAFLFLAGEESALRHAIDLSRAANVPVHWASLYYTSHHSTEPCFGLLFQSGSDFFLQGLPSRAAELCHKEGAKVKVFDSRMEKFCSVQLPLLPVAWQRSFVCWWDAKITAEALIPPEDDTVVEDMPLCLHVIRPLRASLGGAEPAPAQSLEAEFQARAKAAKTLTRLPDKQRLELYGLFKQATEGDCTAVSPGFFDFVGRAKWDAWTAVRGTAQREAMERYCAAVARLTP